jgi:hypothetical protein
MGVNISEMALHKQKEATEHGLAQPTVTMAGRRRLWARRCCYAALDFAPAELRHRARPVSKSKNTLICFLIQARSCLLAGDTFAEGELVSLSPVVSCRPLISVRKPSH